MYLFLDDQRKPNSVTWIELPLYNWDVVRNYNEFTTYINRNGLPKYISFDHDLSFEHYPSEKNPTLVIPYALYKEKTGYDCAKWLTEYCLNKNLKLPEYAVHSMNPAGKENIISLLNSFQNYQQNNC